jgi:uncharacterized protein with HEPN domain
VKYELTKTDIRRLFFINEYCNEIEQIMQGIKDDSERGIPENKNLKNFRITAIGNISIKLLGYCAGFDDEFRSQYDQLDWDYVESEKFAVVRDWRNKINDFVLNFVQDIMPPWKELSEKIIADNPEIVKQIKLEIAIRHGNWAYGRKSLRNALKEVYGTVNIYGSSYMLKQKQNVNFQYRKKDIQKLFQIKEYCREIDECMERFDNETNSSDIKTDAVGFSILRISALCGYFGEQFKTHNPKFDWNKIAEIQSSILRLWTTNDRSFIWDFVRDVKPSLQEFCDKVITENPEITEEIKIRLTTKYPNWAYGRDVMREAMIAVYGTDDISVIKKQKEPTEEISEEMGMEMS